MYRKAGFQKSETKIVAECGQIIDIFRCSIEASITPSDFIKVRTKLLLNVDKKLTFSDVV